MAEDVTCPTCGKLIYSDDLEAMELSPCRCTPAEKAAAAAKPVAKVMAGASINIQSGAPVQRDSATIKPASPPTSGTPAPSGPRVHAASRSEPESPKSCCNCGKDVTGRKRLKDSQGRYWCPDCGRTDEKQKQTREEQTRTACTMCGTEVEVQNILSYNGQFVCRKCYAEQKELEKKTEARINRINSSFKGKEIQRIVPLLVVLGVLVLIILYQLIRKYLL